VEGFSAGNEAPDLASDVGTDLSQQNISRDAAATMSVSALFGSLDLRRTNVRQVGQSEGIYYYTSASVQNDGSFGFLASETTNEPSGSGNVNTSAGSAQITSSLIIPTTPLFYGDPDSPEPTSPVILQTTLPDDEVPLPQSDDEEPALSHSDEGQIAGEIQREYSWLSTLLTENQIKGWGTAYRDFIDVKLLLMAVRGLGMEEMANNRVTKGVFRSSTGEFALSMWEFIDILQLTHSSGTWRNKVTAYFRIKQLYMFAQYNGGDIHFQNREHRMAWETVKYWMVHQEELLGLRWETTRYGSKELRLLVQYMVGEVCHGKRVLF